MYGGGASEIACALAVNQGADKVRSTKRQIHNELSKIKCGIPFRIENKCLTLFLANSESTKMPFFLLL